MREEVDVISQGQGNRAMRQGVRRGCVLDPDRFESDRLRVPGGRSSGVAELRPRGQQARRMLRMTDVIKFAADSGG